MLNYLLNLAPSMIYPDDILTGVNSIEDALNI